MTELISNFNVCKYVEEHYEPVEDKPGYVWLNKRNLQIINIDVLASIIEKYLQKRQESEGWLNIEAPYVMNMREEYKNHARELSEMPYDKAFIVGGNEELCHATGYEVFIENEWWNEYMDSNGEYHYGR